MRSPDHSAPFETNTDVSLFKGEATIFSLFFPSSHTVLSTLRMCA